MSVRPCAWNNSTLTKRMCMKLDIWAFFGNLSRKFRFYLKPVTNNVYFTWRPIYIFGHICLSSSYNEKRFKKKPFRANQNTYFRFGIFFFFENRTIYEVMWQKCGRVWQATVDNIAHAHCLLDNQGYRHTLRICITCYFSTATTFARTILNVTLHVHCLSCYI